MSTNPDVDPFDRKQIEKPADPSKVDSDADMSTIDTTEIPIQQQRTALDQLFAKPGEVEKILREAGRAERLEKLKKEGGFFGYQPEILPNGQQVIPPEDQWSV